MNSQIEKAGLLPVVTLDKPELAEKLADALVKGGIRAVEITFRTADGQKGLDRIAECIRIVCAKHPEMLVGAGTVTNAALAQKAAAAGAQFIVSPGYNPETVDYCISESVPVYPGINCASQIETGLAKGLTVFKFFPCGSVRRRADAECVQRAVPRRSFYRYGRNYGRKRRRLHEVRKYQCSRRELDGKGTTGYRRKMG